MEAKGAVDCEILVRLLVDRGQESNRLSKYVSAGRGDDKSVKGLRVAVAGLHDKFEPERTNHGGRGRRSQTAGVCSAPAAGGNCWLIS